MFIIFMDTLVVKSRERNEAISTETQHVRADCTLDDLLKFNDIGVSPVKAGPSHWRRVE